MPDIPNRDELEAELAKLLGRLNRRHLMRLLEYLGDPPDINNVPESFWRIAGEELGTAIRPFVEKVYLESAERLMNETPIGVDWNIVNQNAFQWADAYTYDLVSGINATSRQAIQQAVGGFFTQQMTLGELEAKLGSIYSPIRAEMIARTEVTRAAVEGERTFVDELGKQGVTMVETWQTREDELVCPICGPLADHKLDDGWTRADGPPAHPRCRCWTIFELEQPQ